MEVMKNAVIKTRTLKPLPGEITNEAINGATLPVKIESARRAIAECTDLPELLRYKSQAEGLAAAVRTMKEVGPELIRAANEMMADAWRKGGELLSQYSNVVQPLPAEQRKGKGGTAITPRGKISRELGLTPTETSSLVRAASTPLDTLYSVVQNKHSLAGVAKSLPRVDERKYKKAKDFTGSLRIILGTGGQMGLQGALGHVRSVDLQIVKHLTSDERKVVKAKIIEIQELLDEIDRFCR